MIATALVLVAALLHATWNTLIKFIGERLLVTHAIGLDQQVAVEQFKQCRGDDPRPDFQRRKRYKTVAALGAGIARADKNR